MTLTDIQQSFYARSFDIESIRYWLWGVGVIVAFISLYLLYKAIQARRFKYSPFGSISDTRVIRSIVRTAFDQRRPFEVQVQTDAGQRRPTLRCSPEYMGNDSITIEVGGLKSLSDKWKGRPVTVFFRVLVNKEYTYYTFPSLIADIHMPRPGLCHISLPMPERLENRQKRSFLRIKPPREFFPGAALWYGETMPPPEKINTIGEWARPRLLYIPERMEQFQVMDLSAGGSRLSVPGQVVRTLKLHFNSTEHLLLMLDLFDPELNKRLRYWMECRIQNVWVEHTTHDVHLGLQFLSWARPKDHHAAGFGEQQAPGIEWLKLSSSHEVEPVGNWIMRRHLELFRENPFEI